MGRSGVSLDKATNSKPMKSFRHRHTNTADIGLETIGLTPGSWLDVDDTCLVRAADGDWLYALGDATHRALLTHQGKYQARVAGNAIGARAHGNPLDITPWGAHVATADSHAVPQVFFTDPEAASVGLTAMQAERLGARFKTVDVNIGESVPGRELLCRRVHRARSHRRRRRARLPAGPPSSDRESPSSCTRPPSQLPPGCPSTACGMPAVPPR